MLQQVLAIIETEGEDDFNSDSKEETSVEANKYEAVKEVEQTNALPTPLQLHKAPHYQPYL